jgi:glutamate N-acetyltransferase / amino-acid N-acetyltransferase
MSKNLSHGITWPRGFRAAGGTCGLKASGAPDLTLIVADGPCTAAGVFTTNALTSAPVNVGQRHLRATGGRVRAVICNSGNANASTGRAGEANALLMCALVAQRLGCSPAEVLPTSTGIIGRPLAMDKIAAGVKALAPRLAAGPAADKAAARGIMTTDLVPKVAARSITLGGKTVRLAGMCKGSGMIAPNMATMLAFITTDAAIAPGALRQALLAATAESFNRISVDQHTSPSDTCLVLASGLAGNRLIESPKSKVQSPKFGPLGAFTAALTELCRDLAYQIVKDGEGATKVYRVRVVGAASIADADRIGRTIVDSPLVKTAVHGGDPNWGRITTAAGYSGAKIKPQAMTLHIGAPKGICVFRKGQPTPAGMNPPAALKKLMAAREVTFVVDIGLGSAAAEWLGCDLSRQYIAINADYTT